MVKKDGKAGKGTRALLTLGVLLPAGAMLASMPDTPPAGAAVSPPSSSPTAPSAAHEAFRNGEAAFVVTEFAYALGPDAKGSGACPAGMTAGVRGLVEALAGTPAGKRRDGESEQAYSRRLALAVNTAPDGKNLCMSPQSGSRDPDWRMVSGRNLRVDGIDLDGANSAKGRSVGATCAHEEFQGLNGERGVDNQFYRVVGCTTGFQSTGQANGFQVEMLTGSWGILMTLKGVEDLRNDPEVEVGLFANADPIQLTAARAPLPYATYAAEQDPRYRAKTHGRIVDGILTIDPVDVRFRNVVNSMIDDRELRDARIRFRFTSDGGLEGILAGYAPVESMYDLQYGARHSRTAKGDLAPERMRLQTSMGRAGALGHSCHGAYHALYQAADGHPDPVTGRCTSISTQYRVRMVPAFVVDVRTRSVNAPLAAR